MVYSFFKKSKKVKCLSIEPALIFSQNTITSL
nr:MAG TPA: hypothetical protein [Caudoviricetes sp.]